MVRDLPQHLCGRFNPCLRVKIHRQPRDAQGGLRLVVLAEDGHPHAPDVLFVLGVVDRIPALADAPQFLKQPIGRGDRVRGVPLEAVGVDHLLDPLARREGQESLPLAGAMRRHRDTDAGEHRNPVRGIDLVQDDDAGPHQDPEVDGKVDLLREGPHVRRGRLLELASHGETVAKNEERQAKLVLPGLGLIQILVLLQRVQEPEESGPAGAQPLLDVLEGQLITMLEEVENVEDLLDRRGGIIVRHSGPISDHGDTIRLYGHN